MDSAGVRQPNSKWRTWVLVATAPGEQTGPSAHIAYRPIMCLNRIVGQLVYRSLLTQNTTQFVTRTVLKVYKVKQSHNTPVQAQGGAELYLIFIHDLGTGWVSVTTRPRFTPGERTSGTHWLGGWMGPTVRLDTEARRKIFRLCRGSNSNSPVVQSVVRHYTDWATPAPCHE
jgi:hypothetical protein